MTEKVMDENSKIEIHVCDGVAGKSLYVNAYRIVGCKPWGGGKLILTWELGREALLKGLRAALGIDIAALEAENKALRDALDLVRIVKMRGITYQHMVDVVVEIAHEALKGKADGDARKKNG